MLDIKNISGADVARQMQAISVGIYFLQNLEGTNFTRGEFIVFMWRKLVICEHHTNIITNIEVDLAMARVSRHLVMAVSILQTCLRGGVNLLQVADQVFSCLEKGINHGSTWNSSKNNLKRA